MQHQHQNQQYLADLSLRRSEDGVQIAQKERDAEAEADADENPIENANARPGDQGHGDPDQVRVAVEGDALEELGGFGAEVLERAPEYDRDDGSVTVDESSGAWGELAEFTSCLLGNRWIGTYHSTGGNHNGIRRCSFQCPKDIGSRFHPQTE